MGDFRKEYVQCFRLISREKNSCEEILGEKKSRTEKKKRLKPIILEKSVVRQQKKNSITRDLPEKLFLEPNHPYPSPPTQSDQVVGGYS